MWLILLIINAKNDKYRDQYVIPEKVKYLIDNECLGQKSGAGFYKKIDKGIIHVFDFDSMDYRPINKKRFKAIALAKEQTLYRVSLKLLFFVMMMQEISFGL